MAIEEKDMKQKQNASNMIDQLVEKGLKALEEFRGFDQEQIDEIVKQMALAGLDQHMPLAKLAVEETKRGVYEDKIIKNMFATEYVYHHIKYDKTVGIINENEHDGVIEIAEPVGVIAGVTPVTNPTSTTMFKSLISIKTRNPIVFAFHPSAQKCGREAARILRDNDRQSRSTRQLHPMDRDAFSGCNASPNDPPERFPDPRNRRRRHGEIRLQLRKTGPWRRTWKRSVLHREVCQPEASRQ